MFHLRWRTLRIKSRTSFRAFFAFTHSSREAERFPALEREREKEIEINKLISMSILFLASLFMIILREERWFEIGATV